MSISTVDDGGWQSSELDTIYTLKDAAVILEVVVEAFNAYMERIGYGYAIARANYAEHKRIMEAHF
jgi:hypothetical protein